MGAFRLDARYLADRKERELALGLLPKEVWTQADKWDRFRINRERRSPARQYRTSKIARATDCLLQDRSKGLDKVGLSGSCFDDRPALRQGETCRSKTDWRVGCAIPY